MFAGVRGRARWSRRLAVYGTVAGTLAGGAGLGLTTAGAVAAVTLTQADIQPQTFTTTGQSAYTAPAGINEVKVEAVGGSAVDFAGSGPNIPAADVVATIPVTPGQTYYAEVGGIGKYISPGTNGGGNGAYGGGGASDFRTCSVTDTSCLLTGNPSSDPRLVTAGGAGAGGSSASTFDGAGGPAGVSNVTGAGNGADGSDGTACPDSADGGAGGVGAPAGTGGAGSLGAGSAGGAGTGGTGAFFGGGGGWFGGGGGGQGYTCEGGGGGGSSYVESTVAGTTASYTTADPSATPEVVVTPLVATTVGFKQAVAGGAVVVQVQTDPVGYGPTTGQVEIDNNTSSGTTDLCTVTLAHGQATVPGTCLPPGSYQLTGAYQGDGQYLASTSSSPSSLTVAQATPRVKQAFSAAHDTDTVTVMRPTTGAAEFPTPTGTVTLIETEYFFGFSGGYSWNASLTDGKVTFPVTRPSFGWTNYGAAAHTVLVATYNGDTYYATASNNKTTS